MKYTSIILATILTCYLAISAYASDNINTTSWQTYTNSQYDFAIKYPSRLTTSKQFSRAYFLRNTWSMSNNTNAANSNKQHSIIQIQLQNATGKGVDGEPYYYQSYVRVGVSGEPADVANCDNSQSSVPPDQTQFTTVINNLVFNMSDFSDAGMMQYNSGTSYSHVFKNRCYRIEYVETGSNSHNIPDYANVTDHNQVIAKAIIQSFRFIDKSNLTSMQLIGDGFGNITSATPYNLTAVKAALSEYDVEEKPFMTEGIKSTNYTVMKGKAVIAKLFSSPMDKSKILCGATNVNIAKNPLNVKIGDPFSTIYHPNIAPHCFAGLEEMSGNVICPAPNAANVFYVFNSKSGGVDGKVPASQEMSDWKVVQIDWLADLNAKKYLAQFCRMS